MQPLQALPTQFRELNATVQTIATKVEVHSVMRGDVQQMRRELSTIEGRLSSHTSYKQP
jgi:hypothetical protein